ncbi:DgyrCDS4638 [Dimorphilus gyrociliatus]|uniref:DgyrCDS4638 n=1 Tax=Dimorphilus gyrociliatus TaxID=2664684 RepID=A0A7I8VI31_9ANNE|nr:DgyrCDS4638 [Dimorphilus gyrociliatus]
MLRKEWEEDEETERDMGTKYGFAIENDASKLESIVANGLVTSAAGDSSYHPLGSSLLGVYVCKHADVCLRHASIRNGTAQVMRLIIFKCDVNLRQVFILNLSAIYYASLD